MSYQLAIQRDRCFTGRGILWLSLRAVNFREFPLPVKQCPCHTIAFRSDVLIKKDLCTRPTTSASPPASELCKTSRHPGHEFPLNANGDKHLGLIRVPSEFFAYLVCRVPICPSPKTPDRFRKKSSCDLHQSWAKGSHRHPCATARSGCRCELQIPASIFAGIPSPPLRRCRRSRHR